MRPGIPLSASFVLLFSASGLLYGQNPANLTQGEKDKQIIDVLRGTSSLWRDPGEIESLNLLHGASRPEHGPAGKLVFVKEDAAGATPKFEVSDENGVHWKVKLGKEAHRKRPRRDCCGLQDILWIKRIIQSSGSRTETRQRELDLRLCPALSLTVGAVYDVYDRGSSDLSLQGITVSCVFFSRPASTLMARPRVSNL